MSKIARKTYRAFHIAPGSALVVAVCGTGKVLREAFRQLNDEKIAVVLTEDDELNANKIAFSDEVVILNESAQLSDFEKKIALMADALLKPVSTLTEVKQTESEETPDDEKQLENTL